MRLDKQAMCLYAVTDRTWTGRQSLYEQVEDALRGGVTCVQLREKELDEAEFFKEAIALQDLCKRYHVPFIINDNVEIAIKSKADGIHVGQQDMAAKDVRKQLGDQMILGVSVETVEQAVAAEQAGADYLGVGAMFYTSTKNDASAVSYDTLKAICSSVSIPVVAIGGIKKENMQQLSGSGVDGVALVSAIFAADDIVSECRALRRLSEQMMEEKAAKTMKCTLTIAGSDSSGGAGIQADVKTMTMNGVYAMSAITALTAQNTTGVTGIMNVTPEFLEKQIDAVFTDIRPDGVKIGMVSSAELVQSIGKKLREYKAENIVVDPVMVATSGSRLISSDGIETLKQELFPLAAILTPNIPEAELLADMHIETECDMIKAAEKISSTYGCAVLCKGGHSINDANDLLYTDGSYEWFEGKRIDNPNTHGTGCTLSSAICANLAKGYDLADAVRKAKAYISDALSDMLDLGKGSGPMNHAFDLKGRYRK